MANLRAKSHEQRDKCYEQSLLYIQDSMLMIDCNDHKRD